MGWGSHSKYGDGGSHWEGDILTVKETGEVRRNWQRSRGRSSQGGGKRTRKKDVLEAKGRGRDSPHRIVLT